VILSLAIEKRWDYWDDLPPEKEDELIQKIAEYVVEHKLDLIAEMLLETGGPMTSIFASFGLNLFGPYLEFFGADTYTALLRRRQNTQRLIDAIEKIKDEKERKN
jgi:acyl-CoA reductase-like NAD-dependent aldehyde dehydrogenase